MSPARDLPAYSGAMVACPKCGMTGVETHYHGGLPYPGENPRGDKWACWIHKPRTEHLCRLCGNCGYDWIEATADSTSTGLRAAR